MNTSLKTACINDAVLPTVEALMAYAFFPGRPARSAAYKAGVTAKLEHILKHQRINCHYRRGTAEFDAFFAGVEEGSFLVRDLV